MAAVSELITLGIGTPSTIPHLLTVGLFDSTAIVYEHGPARVRALGRVQGVSGLSVMPGKTLTNRVRQRTLVPQED